MRWVSGFCLCASTNLRQPHGANLHNRALLSPFREASYNELGRRPKAEVRLFGTVAGETLPADPQVSVLFETARHSGRGSPGVIQYADDLQPWRVRKRIAAQQHAQLAHHPL